MPRSKHQVKINAQLYVVVSYSIHFHNTGFNTGSELTRRKFPGSSSQDQSQGQGCLKMPCCTSLCGNDLLYKFGKGGFNKN